MDDQPVALQRRDQVPNRGGETDGGRHHHDQHQANHEGTQEPEVAAQQHQQEDHRDHQRSGGAELVHVAPRHAVCGQSPGHHCGCVDERGQCGEGDGDAGCVAAGAGVTHRVVGGYGFAAVPLAVGVRRSGRGSRSRHNLRSGLDCCLLVNGLQRLAALGQVPGEGKQRDRVGERRQQHKKVAVFRELVVDGGH